MEITTTTAGRFDWHDLRKDPTDAPSSDGFYLVAIPVKANGSKIYMVARWCEGWNCHKDEDGSVSRDHEMTDIIGWKEIQPMD